MSVFRFEAPPSSSKPLSKRMKGKSRDSKGPTFAFSTSPSLLQDITLEKKNMDIDADDSCDSSSDILKSDYVEQSNYESQIESGSESQVEFVDMGMRNTASSGLTMKEYEEQLKKLTAENFNLKLRVYFVEERLSKVTGISDKEDLIKKNIQLKVTCESQIKELEKKQELLFEASKAFELLQKEHAEEMERIVKEKDREIGELEEKLLALEATHNELKARFPNLENSNDPDYKTIQDYEKQISDLETTLRDEEDRYKDLENALKDTQLELESYQLKSQRIESELDQRMKRIEELVDELEEKEHDLASANFKIRKLEDELMSKQREDEIMRERIEEKNKTIESLKSSLASKDGSIEVLENRIAKERSSMQTLQSKLDTLSFQNARLKEELDILQSRLRRTAENLSPRGKLRASEDDIYKQKYEDLLRMTEEQEAYNLKKFKELEEKLSEKDAEAEDYQELFDKHKKLEDDHRKACTALKNFIKRSSEEKKEREALNHILINHEEVIAELKAELDKLRNNPIARMTQDDKLSLAGTGDNNRKYECPAADKGNCCYEKDKKIKEILSNLEKKENQLKAFQKKGISCTCEVEEKMEKVSELEAEVLLLQQRLDSKDPEERDVEKHVLVNELESKKYEIEKLNGELRKRNFNLQELVNKELWDKNKQIEKLEKKLTEINELREKEVMLLNQTLHSRNQQLKILHCKLQEVGVSVDLQLNLFENNLSEDINKVGSGDCGEKNENVDVLNQNLRQGFERSGTKIIECLQKECILAKEQAEKANSVRAEAAEVCSLLSLRLEELADFLDSLLSNSELLTGISMSKRQDIKRALEKSRELSKQLSQSFSKKNANETSLMWSTIGEGGLSFTLSDTSLTSKESFGIFKSRDKVISEQTMIINRLRDQLKVLNQEIKQRDIELSHCHGDFSRQFENLSIQGIEGQSLNIGQDLSDEDEDFGEQCSKREVIGEEEKEKEDKSCKKSLFPDDRILALCNHETSESEAWSEPDRSVSLARMGRLEDASGHLSHRNSKADDSSESSEGTLNENPRNSGKRCRSTESEIRRLQSRIKLLDETNENLRLEVISLKTAKGDCSPSSRIQRNEEANLLEKLRKTMDRLDECSLTCRQLEEKLAGALERASTSAMQLSKATETISLLEEEIAELKKEIDEKNLENEEMTRRVKELESKIEEITKESELKILDAIKQKENAEKKTLEVECRLKDAENMSKEVESRVTEIEKKICETKKFKKETVLHFKEAEKHVDTAEKMMEEAEKIKLDAEKKSKDFQNFIDLMRKEVEEKMKDAEKRVRKSEKEKEELEKQVLKLKKRLLEAEKNKTEVEAKVKEGKETIQCMEEKLKELEIAMDQCSEEAQRKIIEMQKKADAKVAELEMKVEEREWVRKTEVEKKMAEAEKISRELEVGFKRQLEEAERKVKKARENAEASIKAIQEESMAEKAELLQRIAQIEAEKKEECAMLRRQLDEVKLEASEFELELTKLTNEKIHLEEELKKMFDKECALVKDNKEIKGKYESSIHELEDKLLQLTLNKSQLASRLEEIETTNIDLVSRVSAIRGKETMLLEHEFSADTSSPPHGSNVPNMFNDLDICFPPEFNENRYFTRQGSAVSDPGENILGIHTMDSFTHPRRHLNSSPDLGIESDPGRFSSLEANQQINGEHGESPGNCSSSEIKKLEYENAELKRRLMKTRQALEETLTQLSAANQRKKQVERAICKQLHKTHHILKKAKVNFEAQDGDLE